MSTSLSAESEAFVAKMIADGWFADRDQVLERCVAAFRAQLGDIPMVPPEHMEAVEEGLESIEKYGTKEFTEEDRERLLQRALARAEAERARAAG